MGHRRRSHHHSRSWQESHASRKVLDHLPRMVNHRPTATRNPPRLWTAPRRVGSLALVQYSLPHRVGCRRLSWVIPRRRQINPGKVNPRCRYQSSINLQPKTTCFGLADRSGSCWSQLSPASQTWFCSRVCASIRVGATRTSENFSLSFPARFPLLALGPPSPAA